MIGTGEKVGAIAAMPDHRAGIGEEAVGMLDPRNRIADGFRLCP
jgi:hypothetical protein